MRYAMCISYDGTSYHGWQKQENTNNTVQYHVDHCLSVLTRQVIESTGCGRTDTGVHAKKFYLHFDTISAIGQPKQIIYKGNKILPKDIVIHSLHEVNDAYHARFGATKRSYVYRITTVKDPFDAYAFYYPYPEKLDVTTLNTLSSYIVSAQDFAAFCKTGTAVKSNLCKIQSCYWQYTDDNTGLEFHITADRFLRGMIRLLVGAMLQVIRGKITETQFKEALYNQKLISNPWSVDAKGLCLYGVEYSIRFA